MKTKTLTLALLFSSVLSYSQTTKITIDLSTPIGSSFFEPGISLIDKSLNPSTKKLIKSGLSFVNTYIMGWGCDDPWPDSTSAEPTNWSSLDDNMNIATQVGLVPVISLCEAPWWMKGILKSNEWGTGWADTRICDNMMNKWLHLVQRIGERYMVAPYNVRYFQVWNEFKGYYNATTNSWDYNNSPGDTIGSNHKHGYTYMYNKVYTVLKQVAKSKGISPSSIQIGGPYVVMDSEVNKATMSNPSSITGPWGTLDQRPLDAISYWLKNKIGAEFIAVDGGNNNKNGSTLVDAFGMCEKFAAVDNWIRQQSNGGATLPIFWSEWYAGYVSLPNTDSVNNAVGAYAVSKLILSDAAISFIWGGTQSHMAAPPLWESSNKELLWYYTYKTLGQNFGTGQTIYKSTSNTTNIAVLATKKQAMLINKTNTSQSFTVNGTILSPLNPYEVRFINLNPSSDIPNL